ncbi:MAG: hypothetical protein ACE5GT_07280 [Rhodospirillales bacterium]
MTNLRHSLMTAILVAAAASLAACEAVPYRLPGPRAVELPPDQGLIVFKAGDVGATPAKRIQYADNEQRVDYALFKGNGAQAEFVYMDRVYSLTVSFHYPYTIRDKVEAWNFSKGRSIEWGTAMRVYTRVGPLFVRPYRLGGQRACFGVNGEWEIAPDDPKLWYTRIMFGYYCAAPGEALPQDRMLALVDNIGLKGFTERRIDFAVQVRNFYSDVDANFKDRAQTKRVIEMAKNLATEGEAGINEFPFDYAEYYVPGDNGERTD